jgi:hypothetical protein
MTRHRWILLLASIAIVAGVSAVPVVHARQDAPSTTPPATTPTTTPTIDPKADPASDPKADSAGATADSDDSADDTTPQRVIVNIDRHKQLFGHIIEETTLLLTIRTLEGEVVSFTKPRRFVRLVEPKPGQTGTVIMRDGQRRHGIILEDSFERVVVDIEGIHARIKREFVDEVFLDPTFREQYEHFKKVIRPGMTAERLRLCQWLVEHREWELAATELDAMIEEEPLEQARELRRIVEAQLEIIRQRELAASAAEEAVDVPSRPSTPVDSAGLITDEDVNIIRVYEIAFDDPPRLTVRPETIRRLIDRYSDNPLVPAAASERAAMFRADPLALVRLMFRLRARDLYHEIQVETEPHAMNIFRQRVHNAWLMNNCATSQCHGGPDAGVFMLHRKRYTEPRVRYTNFLILERLSVDPDWPLINYQRPEDSLILQYGLPRHLARKAHPEVPGWSPVFAGRQNRMRDHTVEWIRSMLRPRPVYPVTLKLPKPTGVAGPEAASTDAPAAAPEPETIMPDDEDADRSR